jgi:hypothetical protein
MCVVRVRIVGHANQGLCVGAIDPWAAYEHIERLDHICEIVLKSGVAARSVARHPTSLAAWRELSPTDKEITGVAMAMPETRYRDPAVLEWVGEMPALLALQDLVF